MMQKTHWNGLPREVQDAFQRERGGVVEIRMISEGWNSDTAFVAETESGRLFVKGAQLDNGLKARQLRREILINPYVTHLSPAIRLQVEAAGWLIVGFDYIEGRRADYSPNSPDIALALEVLDELGNTPCPNIELMYADRRRSNYADVEHLRRVMGNSLLHTDLNPSNVWISRGRAYLLDWARPTRGAAWLDGVALTMCLMTCGHTPRDAEAIVSALPAWKDLDPAGLDGEAHYGSAARSGWGLKPIDDPWSNASVEAARRWWDYRRGLTGKI